MRSSDTRTNAIEAMLESELVELHGTSRYRDESEFAFRDHAMREAAYESLAECDRQSMHARAAAWLHTVGERDAALLAHHYAASGDRVRAAESFRAAADRAVDALDFATAAELSARAIAAG